MSVGVNIGDLLTPALRRKLDALRGGRARVLEAGAAAVVAEGTRAFRDASARPAAWPELAASTLKKKAGKGNLLIDTGALVQSIVAGPASDERVEVGTDRPYAPFLQSGTKKMPARPFMPWTDEGEMTEAAQLSVREAMEARIGTLLNR